MSKEMIQQELTVFWEKLCYYSLRLAEIPKAMVKDPGAYSTASKIKTGAILLALAAVVVSWLFRFLKAPIKKKFKILFSTIALLLFVSVIGFFALKDMAMPGDYEDASIPATVSVNREELPAARAYRISVGTYNTRFLLNYTNWGLTNDTVAIESDDGSILFLSGLQSFPGGNGVFMTRTLQEDYAFLSRAIYDSGSVSYNDYADVLVYRDTTLRTLGQTGEPGSVMPDPMNESEKLEILECEEDRMLFLHHSGWTASDGEPLVGLGEVRQMGDDVIKVVLHSVVGIGDMAGFNSFFHDPREDETQLARMREVLNAFFDGSVRVLRGLTQEEVAALLPTRVVEATEHFATYNGRFSIPCSRLLSLAADVDGHAEMRWLGEDMDGETVLYTLHNEAAAFDSGNSQNFNVWKEAFEAGKKTPDQEMSDFIGCCAVAWEDGWLLSPASVYFKGSPTLMDNYYYLTAEPTI